jgi:hypothetical protein
MVKGSSGGRLLRGVKNHGAGTTFVFQIKQGRQRSTTALSNSRRLYPGHKVCRLQVDRNLMLYLPRLAVLVTIVADRPGAWFPGPLGSYQASCFGVFWGVIFKKKNSRVDSRIT